MTKINIVDPQIFLENAKRAYRQLQYLLELESSVHLPVDMDPEDVQAHEEFLNELHEGIAYWECVLKDHGLNVEGEEE